MISLRLAVPAVLVAAAIAGCITYFAVPGALQAEADQRLPPATPSVVGHPVSRMLTKIQRPNMENHNIAAFERAAEAILKRAENATASAHEPLFAGRIPLPRKRPGPRQ